MYKLVTIDLDGTLLNSYGRVSEHTKDVFKQAKKQGVELVLASGRPIKSTLSIAKELDIANYIVAGNGAIVYDVNNDEYIFDKFLSKDKVYQIIELCEKNSINYNIYTVEEIIARDLKYNTLFYHKENANKTIDKRTNITITENIKEYIEKLDKPNFFKITICDESEIIFKNILKKLKTIDNITVLDTAHMSNKTIRQGSHQVDIAYFFTEISAIGINKWEGISYLADKLGIDGSEVIGIGDNINDVEMIQGAGLGVAMENAAPYVKEQADYITKDNESDGVAYVIEKFILNASNNDEQ